MAGYSGTPLVRKLGIKPGQRVGLVAAPPEFAELLGPLPDGTSLRDAVRGQGPFHVIVFFSKAADSIMERLPDLRAKLEPSGGLWVAWPKKSSGVRTDVTEDVVRALALAARLVDNKVCAIDEIWSGLRLVIRVADRKQS